MSIVVYSSEQWDKFASLAHYLVFKENRPSEMNRIDFALVVLKGEKPLGYMTIREIDSETCYIQYGGAFESSKDTVMTYPAYKELIDWLSVKYKYCTTLIENTNLVMLKFAMKVGFKIIGIRNFKDQILLENFIQWRD